jgi:hypothetical protein
MSQPEGETEGQKGWSDAIESILRIFRSTAATAIVVAFAVFLVVVGFSAYSMLSAFGWNSSRGASYKSSGSPEIRLERLQQIVCTRIVISDILTGDTKWLKGAWIVQGDALLGVDMNSARVVSQDDTTKTLLISLPGPTVISSRVNLEKTREYDLHHKSYIPFASFFVGNRESFREDALKETQRLVERAAWSDAHIGFAKENAETALREFFSELGWQVDVQWQR